MTLVYRVKDSNSIENNIDNKFDVSSVKFSCPIPNSYFKFIIFLAVSSLFYSNILLEVSQAVSLRYGHVPER